MKPLSMEGGGEYKNVVGALKDETRPCVEGIPIDWEECVSKELERWC